jgi:hypothetical protein
MKENLGNLAAGILADWAKEKGIPARLLSYRLSKGWSTETAILLPVRKPIRK